MTQQLLHPNHKKNHYRSPIAEPKGVGVNTSPRANDGVTTTGRGFVLSGSGRLVAVKAGV